MGRFHDFSSDERRGCPVPDGNDVQARRDLLVQQLLEERRRRLQLKLANESVFGNTLQGAEGGYSADRADQASGGFDDTLNAKPEHQHPLHAVQSRTEEPLWDSATQRLDDALDTWGSSSPRRALRQSTILHEDLGVDDLIRAGGANHASRIWLPEELEDPRDVTFGIHEIPSSSSRSGSGSRSRSVEASLERRSSPTRAQAHSSMPFHVPQRTSSAGNLSQRSGGGTLGTPSTPGSAVSTAQRRPQSAPRTGHRISARPMSARGRQQPATPTVDRVRHTSGAVSSTPTSTGSGASCRARPATANTATPNSAARRQHSAPPTRGNSTMAQTPVGNRRPFDAKLKEWSMRHHQSAIKQQQARREKELKELEECTFKPSINRKSQFFARRTRGCYLEKLEDRLHHEADKRSTLRQKAKELLEADEMCNYTFQPQINNRPPSGEENGHTPLHLRTDEIRQRQQERVTARQRAEDLRADCSFQPRISEKSERIVRKKRDEVYKHLSQGDASCIKLLGPVEERLYAGAQDMLQRRTAQQNSVSEESSMPSVDEESRRICKSSVYFQGAQQDFLTRQQTFELAKQRRMEVRAQHANAQCSFRPEISDTSRQIVSNNLDFIGETVEERINRLAVKDVEHRDQVRGALEQLQYRECTFKPSLTATTQVLAARFDEVASLDSGADAAAGMPVHERLYRHGMNKGPNSDVSRMEECTFKPSMDPQSSKRYSYVKGHYSTSSTRLMDNIKDELDKRDFVLAEKRREKEQQEQSTCTFRPSTTKPYEEPEQPVVVSGLGRFFELREMAQRQQREKQEREAKAFHPEVNARYDGVTIPEPFNLSQGCTDLRRHQESLRSDDYSFTPQTNESANRELLRQIMLSDV